MKIKHTQPKTFHGDDGGHVNCMLPIEGDESSNGTSHLHITEDQSILLEVSQQERQSIAECLATICDTSLSREIRQSQTLSLHSEGDGTFRLHYSNRGEPYREGVDISFDTPPESNQDIHVGIFITNDEAARMSSFLSSAKPNK